MALPRMSRRRARLSAADICARVSLAAFAGSGALPSSSSASGASRSAKASSAQRLRHQLREYFPALMGPRHHLDRRRARAVACHRAQLMGIGAHHVGQHVRVTPVALGTGHAVALPVPRCLQRVHPEHRVPGRDQRAHPRAAVGRRVARGISAPGPHRSGREPLDSSGSCHPVIRSCTATTSAQTGQVTVSGPPSAMPAPVHRYVPVACTSPSPTSSDGDPYAYLWASPQSDRTR